MSAPLLAVLDGGASCPSSWGLGEACLVVAVVVAARREESSIGATAKPLVSRASVVTVGFSFPCVDFRPRYLNSAS
jgi:hypothetical protein